MKIGITERGDAALDLSWVEKLKYVDGAILITKNCGKKEFLNSLSKLEKPIILHSTCTGMGGTHMEPNVPSPLSQINVIKRIIRTGILPVKKIVIRIDPIYPFDLWYLSHLLNNINREFTTEEIKEMRFRVSVMDFYPHTKDRLKLYGYKVTKGFQAYPEQFEKISNLLSVYTHMTFETCAEDKLTGDNIKHIGCVSEEDIRRMGLNPKENLTVNPQNRNGCLCLSCKTELLNNKYRCPHKCLYCYWKDNPKMEGK